MPYSPEQQKKLKSLLESVEQRKAHQYAAPTYLDSAALAEIRSVVEAELEGDTDKETLADSVEILRYLADSYESMNKVAYATKMHELLLKTEIKAIQQFNAGKKRLKDDFYSAVRARNYYGKDECTDLSEIVLPFLGLETVTKTLTEIIESYPRLKRDSMELTDKYLSVIDKVEEKIEGQKKTDLCHEYWSLKKQYLADLGIVWRSPAELNPGVLFD